MTAIEHAAARAAGAQTEVVRDRLGHALWIATLIWVIGMATVFPVGNDALEAVSVFTFDRIAYLVVFTLLVAMIVRTPAMLRRWGRVEVLIALYLAVVVASWAMTWPAKHAVDLKRDADLLLNSFVMPFTAFVIARHCGWTGRQARTAVCVVVATVGAYLIVVGFIQGLVDWRFLVSEANQSVHHSRSRGPFPNALPYGVLLALLLPVAIALGVRTTRPAFRAALVVLCAGLIESLLFSQLRVAWIGVPVALLYCAAVCPPMRRASIVASFVFLTLMGLALVGLDLGLISGPNGASVQLRGGVGERLVDSGPLYNRVAVFSTALNMIADRPLLGFGFGSRTFEQARDRYLTTCCGVPIAYAAECGVPHNDVLNLLVLLGPIGLLAFVVLVRELWRLLARRAADDDPARAALAAAVQTGLLILIISGQVHDMMYLGAVQVLFFFLAGVVTPESTGSGGIVAPAAVARSGR